MEVWRLKTHKENNLDYLLEIFQEAALDVRIDRNALALTILQECGAQTPRYMDTQFFETMAVNFFKIKEREIKRDLDALNTAYNPLETYAIDHDGDKTLTDTYGDTRTRTDDLTQTVVDGDVTTTHKVSADNEDGVQLRSQDVTSTEDDSITHTGTQTHDHTGTNEHVTSYNDHEHGRKNTPAQDLLLSELEANKLNIYEVLALDFASNLMIAVY